MAPSWWAIIRSRRGPCAVLALVLAVEVVAGPVAAAARCSDYFPHLQRPPRRRKRVQGQGSTPCALPGASRPRHRARRPRSPCASGAWRRAARWDCSRWLRAALRNRWRAIGERGLHRRHKVKRHRARDAFPFLCVSGGKASWWNCVYHITQTWARFARQATVEATVTVTAMAATVLHAETSRCRATLPPSLARCRSSPCPWWRLVRLSRAAARGGREAAPAGGVPGRGPASAQGRKKYTN